jgi:hypothetical protein
MTGMVASANECLPPFLFFDQCIIVSIVVNL